MFALKFTGTLVSSLFVAYVHSEELDTVDQMDLGGQSDTAATMAGSVENMTGPIQKDETDETDETNTDRRIFNLLKTQDAFDYLNEPGAFEDFMFGKDNPDEPTLQRVKLGQKLANDVDLLNNFLKIFDQEDQNLQDLKNDEERKQDLRNNEFKAVNNLIAEVHPDHPDANLADTGDDAGDDAVDYAVDDTVDEEEAGNEDTEQNLADTGDDAEDDAGDETEDPRAQAAELAQLVTDAGGVEAAEAIYIEASVDLTADDATTAKIAALRTSLNPTGDAGDGEGAGDETELAQLETEVGGVEAAKAIYNVQAVDLTADDATTAKIEALRTSLDSSGEADGEAEEEEEIGEDAAATLAQLVTDVGGVEAAEAIYIEASVDLTADDATTAKIEALKNSLNLADTGDDTGDDTVDDAVDETELAQLVTDVGGVEAAEAIYIEASVDLTADDATTAKIEALKNSLATELAQLVDDVNVDGDVAQGLLEGLPTDASDADKIEILKESLVDDYVEQVNDGDMTAEDVPEKFRSQVEAKINEAGNEAGTEAEDKTEEDRQMVSAKLRTTPEERQQSFIVNNLYEGGDDIEVIASKTGLDSADIEAIVGLDKGERVLRHKSHWSKEHGHRTYLRKA